MNVPEYALENHPADKLYIDRVRNCIVTRSSLVLTLHGVADSCLFEGLSFQKVLQMNLVGMGSVIRNPLSRLPSGPKYYHLLNIWGTGYHHWLVEVAPKLFLFEEQIRNGVIILPELAPRFIREFLGRFKFDNVATFRGNVFLKELNIISNPNSGHYNPTHLLPFRKKMLDEYIENNQDESLRIYVSRKNSRGRKVINENDVEEFLKQRGFICIELENVTFSEQVSLFSKCEIFISIHGAALTNMLFMPQNGRVIELYAGGFADTDFFNACYKRLSSILDLNHEYIISERHSVARRYSLHSDDIYVELHELARILDTQL